MTPAGVSRDEARELAVIALLVAIGLRIGAGLLQAIDEVARFPLGRNVLSRLFSQVGSTVGILMLAAVLLVVLSPSGSIGRGLRDLVRKVAGVVAAVAVAGAFYSLSFSFNSGVGRLTFAMINGLSAAVLAGTGWWILRNFDDDR